MRGNRAICTGVLLATATLATLAPTSALAGATIPFGEDKSVSVGFGMRGSYSSIENAAPDGSHSNDFNLDSARIFLGASLNKNIKGMFNTEWDGDRIRVLDAAAQFAISPELNVWAGRLLSPSDRANMAGPYYSLGGGYWAGVASRYGYNGGIFRGRDDGVVVWGNLAGGKLGYSFGAFEGHTFGIGSLTDDQAKAAGISASDKPMFAGRLQYDFWDAEPGYYGTGSYLGSKDILAIGMAGRQQKDGVLTTGGIGDYESWNVDFLMEKRLGTAGAVSIEAAYYDYDTGNVILAEQGKAWSAGGGYIFPIALGSLQPYLRYQKFEADTGIDTRQEDLGVNWIIDGYNAQLGAVYSRTKMTRASDQSRFVVALQLQY
ncbi:porin [Pseudoduganella albidiflava]|uniref:Outer membrane channel protein n=1 Tax=Pseudoduganella albidiflava TaxID=321983 RepID=A0AA88C596_9BURK|nr:porin [Pseudoduganella albidiflava]GGY61914.1 outer membrane channel protein [Pseudoduganella albidiflava]